MRRRKQTPAEAAEAARERYLSRYYEKYPGLDEPINQKCYSCLAKPGNPCVTPSGIIKDKDDDDFHKPRKAKARGYFLRGRDGAEHQAQKAYREAEIGLVAAKAERKAKKEAEDAESDRRVKEMQEEADQAFWDQHGMTFEQYFEKLAAEAQFRRKTRTFTFKPSDIPDNESTIERKIRLLNERANHPKTPPHEAEACRGKAAKLRATKNTSAF